MKIQFYLADSITSCFSAGIRASAGKWKSNSGIVLSAPFKLKEFRSWLCVCLTEPPWPPANPFRGRLREADHGLPHGGPDVVAQALRPPSTSCSLRGSRSSSHRVGRITGGCGNDRDPYGPRPLAGSAARMRAVGRGPTEGREPPKAYPRDVALLAVLRAHGRLQLR